MSDCGGRFRVCFEADRCKLLAGAVAGVAVSVVAVGSIVRPFEDCQSIGSGNRMELQSRFAHTRSIVSAEEGMLHAGLVPENGLTRPSLKYLKRIARQTKTKGEKPWCKWDNWSPQICADG